MTFEAAIARAVDALRAARDLSGATPVIDALEHFAERVAALPAEEAGWDAFMEECCTRCSCSDEYRPCAGVQAGAACDHLVDDECVDLNPLTEDEADAF